MSLRYYLTALFSVLHMMLLPQNYAVTISSSMASLPVLWRQYIYCDVTTSYISLWRRYLFYDVTNSSTMMSLHLLCPHYLSTMTSLPLYYDVTTSLLWRHYLSTIASLPLYYDVTNPLLWRHYLYYGVTALFTITSLLPLYYDVTTSLLWRHYLSTMTSLIPLLWRHCPLY